jgi:hypothetical protein
MLQRIISPLSWCFLISVVFVGCSNGSGDARNLPPLAVDAGAVVVNGPGAADAAVPVEDKVVATLAVPPEFAGVTVLLAANYFSSFPPVGMPIAYGDKVPTPALVAGQDFPIVTTQAGLQGEYYLSLVVYCQGGGAGRDPVPGIDWVGSAMQPLKLGPGTGTVEAGRVDLILE